MLRGLGWTWRTSARWRLIYHTIRVERPTTGKQASLLWKQFCKFLLGEAIWLWELLGKKALAWTTSACQKLTNHYIRVERPIPGKWALLLRQVCRRCKFYWGKPTVLRVDYSKRVLAFWSFFCISKIHNFYHKPYPCSALKFFFNMEEDLHCCLPVCAVLTIQFLRVRKSKT